MEVLTVEQIRKFDEYTIEHEPISSVDLMERASNVFANWLIGRTSHFKCKDFNIFCGVGNNGGDGLVIARLLDQKGFKPKVYICEFSSKYSNDFKLNLDRLRTETKTPISIIKKREDFPELNSNCFIIDAIFGSGLNRPVTGVWAELIEKINLSKHPIYSVDIPSGLYADKPSSTSGAIIGAKQTLSFEVPKLAFFMPENFKYIGDFFVRSIGLKPEYLHGIEVWNYLITKKKIQSLIKVREKFGHKGTYGHALIIAGSLGKMGAAVLATKASLRTGAGLVSVFSPKCGYEILQISAPEAMCMLDGNEVEIEEIKGFEKYKAIGIGPGIGTSEKTSQAVIEFFKQSKFPLVVDADALNIIAKNKNLLNTLPPHSILTPHPKEFERLFGKTENSFDRISVLRKKAIEFNLYIILKGANTCIATPEGLCYFNNTGNPGMGTGGSGDVLTGMLTALLAQGYSSLDTCLIGVYLHGLVGDIAAEKIGEEALIASDLIKTIGAGFKWIRGEGKDKISK